MATYVEQPIYQFSHPYDLLLQKLTHNSDVNDVHIKIIQLFVTYYAPYVKIGYTFVLTESVHRGMRSRFEYTDLNYTDIQGVSMDLYHA